MGPLRPLEVRGSNPTTPMSFCSRFATLHHHGATAEVPFLRMHQGKTFMIMVANYFLYSYLPPCHEKCIHLYVNFETTCSRRSKHCGYILTQQRVLLSSDVKRFQLPYVIVYNQYSVGFSHGALVAR